MILSLGQYAKHLGVSLSTIYRWLKVGKIKEDFRTFGNHRRFILKELVQKKVLLYARVSSSGQKKDLERQVNKLIKYKKEFYSNFQHKIIQDIGSGINYKKKGFIKLLNLILSEKISHIIVSHKDRLLRFGFEIIEFLCKNNGIKIIIIQENKNLTFEEELYQNVIEIMTIFCAKIYGKRAGKNKLT